MSFKKERALYSIGYQLYTLNMEVLMILHGQMYSSMIMAGNDIFIIARQISIVTLFIRIVNPPGRFIGRRYCYV